MSTKKIQEKIIDNMRRWQKIENASISSTGHVMERTKNPLVRLVMEIIQRDSQMHYHVQEFIAESLESKTISLTPEELNDVWTMIEEHIQLEEKSVELANEAIQALRGRKMVVQEYLLDYLRMDEQKHDKILETLSTIKKGMYPYG
jgi:gamma-glutamyl phosphate reductase